MISSGISILIHPYNTVLALKFLGTFSCLFGIGYMYTAITIPKKLNPLRVNGPLSFLTLAFILNLVNIFFWLLVTKNFEKLVFSLIISTLVFLYLYRNIKRLSQTEN